MKNIDAARALAIAAGVVIIALTAAAFWLSYAHLAEVALDHGLGDAEVRAWAWPACLDLFIVAGEIMWLRAALARRIDWWAIALTGVGSVGSIVLNVAGVTGDRDPSAVPLLDYVVAAVPPTAALLAFGALMRQVHQALAGHAEPIKLDVIQLDPAGEVTVERAEGLDNIQTLPAAEVVTPAVIELTAPPIPDVIPVGVQPLPIVARPTVVIRQTEQMPRATAEVTTGRPTVEPEQVVTRPAIETGWNILAWPPSSQRGYVAGTHPMTSSVPADHPRQMVTSPVTITPTELRRRARTLNREVVTTTGRPVTIERLRDEFGLSRREATDLRREVVGGNRS